MSECCSNNNNRTQESCCSSTDSKMVLFFSCSGGANVAEVADRVARELMFAGKGTMFCLAGLGADIQGMVQTSRDADVNLVIDGCPLDCAKKTFDRHGVTNYTHFRITDLGIEKVKGVKCTEEQLSKAVNHAESLLNDSSAS